MQIVRIISGGERFILLDPSDTETQNFDIRNISNIQIVDTAIKNSYIDYISAKHRYKEAISKQGKRKLRSTITLNVDAEYKNQLSKLIIEEATFFMLNK